MLPINPKFVTVKAVNTSSLNIKSRKRLVLFLWVIFTNTGYAEIIVRSLNLNFYVGEERAPQLTNYMKEVKVERKS